jgi:hypothetical protein
MQESAMIKKRYFVVIPLVAAMAMVGVHYWPGGSGSPATAPAGVAAVEQAARHEAVERLAQMTPVSVPASGVGRFSAELLRQAEDKFRRMVAVRGLITQDRERRALAQEILATPEGNDLVREILLNPEFARQAFGAFQAEARMYSIAVLDEAARQGNVDIAISTTGELAEQLRDAGGTPDKGRAEDLIDMATVIAHNVGSEGLVDGDLRVLARVGFEPNLPKELRKLYVDGFFQGVWKAEGLRSAQATAERLRAL